MTSSPARPLGERCSFAADVRGDDLSGSAPANDRFLLIEQPGPWGRIAVEDSQLDRGVGAQLALACGQSRTRPLLIRRPGRVPQPAGRATPTAGRATPTAGRVPSPAGQTSRPGRKRWFLAETNTEAPTMRTGTVASDAELLELLTAAAPGEPVDKPLYAACTHGRHDACCAIRGRPVARKLGFELGDAAWEVSHLGGDRFAGNLLVLPWGLYYGRVDRENVDLVTGATERGEIVPELFRGCSAFGPAAQAAQAFARVVSGDNRMAAHRPRATRHTQGEIWQVTLDGTGHAPWQVTVERRQGGTPELLTCAAKARLAPPSWALLDLAT